MRASRLASRRHRGELARWRIGAPRLAARAGGSRRRDRQLADATADLARAQRPEQERRDEPDEHTDPDGEPRAPSSAITPR